MKRGVSKFGATLAVLMVFAVLTVCVHFISHTPRFARFCTHVWSNTNITFWNVLQTDPTHWKVTCLYLLGPHFMLSATLLRYQLILSCQHFTALIISIEVYITYILSTKFQEYIVKEGSRVELMAMLGVFGAVISAIQMYPLAWWNYELVHSCLFTIFCGASALTNKVSNHIFVSELTDWTPSFHSNFDDMVSLYLEDI
jgi:hypothetical protein